MLVFICMTHGVHVGIHMLNIGSTSWYACLKQEAEEKVNVGTTAHLPEKYQSVGTFNYVQEHRTTYTDTNEKE
jgi:hypothetical protein